jgi:hypothetical protein
MVKRERDDSEPYSPDPDTPQAEDYQPDRSPSPTPKKAKAKVKKEPKNASGASGGSMGGKTMWDAERSAALVEMVFEAAHKNLDTEAAANKVRMGGRR